MEHLCETASKKKVLENSITPISSKLIRFGLGLIIFTRTGFSLHSIADTNIKFFYGFIQSHTAVYDFLQLLINLEIYR